MNHALSDTITVSKMAAGDDIPSGYEGYLFKTDTITRAVVWQNSGTNNLCIETSGNANDYVRIARSTNITSAEVSGVGTDYGGIGWARCFDGDACSQEDATTSAAANIWSSDWDDQGTTNKYCINGSGTVPDEPFMIWSDNNKIVLSSN